MRNQSGIEWMGNVRENFMRQRFDFVSLRKSRFFAAPMMAI
jgi:hypothetical protein